MGTNNLRPGIVAFCFALATFGFLAGPAAAGSTNGTPWAWGQNDYGQLGDNSSTDRWEPVQVHNLTGVVAVSAGDMHSLAVKSDGTAWAWGDNGRGELGDKEAESMALEPVQVHNLTGVLAIAGGWAFSLAVKSDGTVWAWGWNSYGQLGDNSTTERNEPVQVHNLTGVVAIAAGNAYSLALKSDGTVWAWGNNNEGELGQGIGGEGYYTEPVQVHNLTGVVAIAACADHSLALKSDGTVWAWGYNGAGQLGDNSTTIRLEPVQVHNLTGVVAVSAGHIHSLAVKSDGTLWAWGYNRYGELGDNSTTDRHEPVQVHNLTGVVAIAGGYYHSLAVKSDGSVWAWGDNGSGQLGDNSTTERDEPVQVHNVTGASAVAASGQSLAIAQPFTISGCVTTAGGTGIPGVTMLGLPGNPATQADGSYTATVNYGWAGTVTPALAGYTFTPTSNTYTSLTANQTDNYTGAIEQFTISGSVKTSDGTAIPGVTMSGLPGNPVTQADGSYTATVNYGSSPKVTPTKTGYNFAPPSKTYGSVTANQTDDYTGTLLTFTISGSVRNAGGTGIPGVTMSGLPGNPATEADGSYTATVNYGWSGTVTPTKAGGTFAPPSKTYGSVTANQTDNYTGTVLTFTISGSVKTAGGVGIPGVTLNGLPGSPVTGAGGSYTATVDYGSSPTVTPTKTGYTFAPPTRTHPNVTANQTGDYTGTLLTFTISGSVKTPGGAGIESVTLNGLPGSPETRSDGSYTATIDYGWSGTVTPTKAGYIFSPPMNTYVNVKANQTDNYTGTILTYVISGSVKTAGGVGIPGVTLNGLPSSPVTGADGSYQATVVYGWSGTATPTKTGFEFNPTSRTYDTVTVDTPDQDYTQQVGSLQMTLDPPEAVAAGAKWRVDFGPWQESGAKVDGLAVGDHAVDYMEIPGWAVPNEGELVTLADAQATALSRTYTAQVGGLQVTLGPPEAVAAGAKWRVDFGAWQASGATVGALAVGAHVVDYMEIPGWAVPDSGEIVTITDGQETVFSRTYATVSVTIAVSPSNVGLTVTVDGVTYTAPTPAFAWAPNSTHTIATASPQAGSDGGTYTFLSWSDTETQTHTITPGASGTYTATFTGGPQMDVQSAGDIDFGPVMVGLSKTMTYVVKNTGTGKLSVDVSVDWPFDVPEPPPLLTAGQQTSVSIVFAPTTVGLVSKTITLKSNGGTTTRTAKGTGTQPKWTLSLQPSLGTGTTNPPAGTYTYDVGTPSAAMKASPVTGANFLGWVGSAVQSGHELDNPITIPSGAAGETVSLAAVFGLRTVSVVARVAIAVETTAGEPAKTGQFTITRTGDLAVPVKVYFTAGGTAKNGTDYTLSALSPVTIAAGQASATITVWPKDDLVFKGDRTVLLTVSANAGYWIDPTKKSATVTITDNEPVVSIEATDKDAGEPGADTGTFTLTALRPSGASAPAVSVKVPYTISGTAKNGTDYYLSPRSPVTVIIPAGAASGQAAITVTPVDDLLAEPAETVVLTLGKGTAYGLDPAKKSATVTIADDEPAPTIVITSPPDLSIVARGKPVTVKWTVAGGPPGTMNRIEWGTAQGAFPHTLGNAGKAPYKATLTAPKASCIVYLRVHVITTGGLHAYSDVQQVIVP